MFLTLQVWALLLLQEGQAAVGWDVVALWRQMGALAKAVGTCPRVLLSIISGDAALATKAKPGSA